MALGAATYAISLDGGLEDNTEEDAGGPMKSSGGSNSAFVCRKPLQPLTSKQGLPSNEQRETGIMNYFLISELLPI